MSIFIRKNFSYPPEVFLSKTIFWITQKRGQNLNFSVIVARSYKNFPRLSASFKFKATNFTVPTKTENLWKPPESTQKHLQAPKTIHPKASAITLNQPSPLKAIQNQPTAKVQFLFFRRFLLVLTKLSFLEGDWALDNNSMKIWHFCYIS